MGGVPLRSRPFEIKPSHHRKRSLREELGAMLRKRGLNYGESMLD
jgi:hypothetical protein